MNKSTTTAVRGILAIGIILCHVNYYNNIFSKVGFLCVGVFFFFSGYNLCYSLYNRDNYIQGFLIKRIKRVYIPFVIINIVYILVMQEKQNILRKIIGIDLAVGILWYVERVLLIYLVFYILTRYLRKQLFNRKLLLGILVWLLSGGLFILLSISYDMNLVFPLSFIVGWVFAIKNDSIKTDIQSKFMSIIAIYVCFYIVLWGLGYIGTFAIIQVRYLFMPVMLSMICGLVSMKIDFENKILTFLGSISYEMYLVHSVVVTYYNNIGFKNIFMIIEYVIITILGSLCMSVIVNLIIKKRSNKRFI